MVDAHRWQSHNFVLAERAQSSYHCIEAIILYDDVRIDWLYEGNKNLQI